MTPSTGSTLQWPYQIPPLPANWKLWRQAIHSLYTKDNSTRLKQKLTTWDQANTFLHWRWEWRIDPSTYALYHRVNNRWTVQFPSHRRRTYIDYQTHTQRTNRTPRTHFPQQRHRSQHRTIGSEYFFPYTHAHRTHHCSMNTPMTY